jgi:nucleoside 2-deoxyribosyltransferase
MKVYLAGKITGDPNYREKFAAAAKKLEERAGVTVISPAVTPEGLKKADYMRVCFAMLESADTAAFLPDWEDSPGAQLEKHWCEYVGKKMVFLKGGAE